MRVAWARLGAGGTVPRIVNSQLHFEPRFEPRNEVRSDRTFQIREPEWITLTSATNARSSRIMRSHTQTLPATHAHARTPQRSIAFPASVPAGRANRGRTSWKPRWCGWDGGPGAGRSGKDRTRGRGGCAPLARAEGGAAQLGRDQLGAAQLGVGRTPGAPERSVDRPAKRGGAVGVVRSSVTRWRGVGT